MEEKKAWRDEGNSQRRGNRSRSIRAEKTGLLVEHTYFHSLCQGQENTFGDIKKR